MQYRGPPPRVRETCGSCRSYGGYGTKGGRGDGGREWQSGDDNWPWPTSDGWSPAAGWCQPMSNNWVLPPANNWNASRAVGS
eukprot:NODE_27564_length_509_cov_1.167539.p3 GENE.NODE_27564_length_509_cov_1.167539~~NODE_27564_length_509_cov_1.167539.p3  ORF type:complete len:82 (-),score=10.91 NODE_27564_length_509_cov_1.167539:100-345(-)